jgi:hypothetical protein
MGNQIVGVRYIGKKDFQEDTVCKTGAAWAQGQVHNFAENLAKLLLVHTDSFERADISATGSTYLSRGKQQKSQGVAAFVNLTAMSIDQMALMARIEFNRVISTEGKDEDQVRREVHALMANDTIDQEAERMQEGDGDDKVAVPYMATPEEYAALMAGTVVLAIVPAEIAVVVPLKSVESETSELPEEEDQKTLPELLAGLEKPELMDFARQEGITFSNAATAEKLREKIFAELSARQTEQQQAA